MMALHWVDYAIILVLTLSILTGLIRGFVRELIALCVWVTAIWVGYTYAPEVSPWLRSYLHDGALRTTVSFILLLLATLLIGGLLSSALSFVLNRSPLKGTDRLLGMGFGLVRGTFIVALLIGVLNLTSLAKDTEFKNSHLYDRFKPISEWIFSFMPHVIHQVNGLQAKEKKLEIVDTQAEGEQTKEIEPTLSDDL
ncbi:MAG: CvpA family protein [Legionellaceae bacterium]|nr:CvpA family protein [Legionellaceae bacterium]